MNDTRLRVTLAALAMLLCIQSKAYGRPSEDPEALAIKARLALEGNRFQEAADLMDEVNRLDPHPAWLANAGYARMMAGQLERAIIDLSAALQDERLKGEDRVRANDRLNSATAAKAHLARADEAKAAGNFVGAAEGYDRAFALIPIGPYALEAANLWERAGNLDVAEERYKTVVTKRDLNADQSRVAADSLARVAKAKIDRDRLAVVVTTGPEDGTPIEPEKPKLVEDPDSPIAGWVLIGTGLAAVGLGVTGFVIADGQRSEAASTNDEDRWKSLQSSAETWWNVGLVASGVGVAAVVTGIIVTATHDDAPDTRGSLHVGGTPLRGGGLLTAFGHF